MKIRTADAGGTSLALAEAGAGGRPFLLLHGFTGAKEDFTDWLDPLAALGWHAVAPDNRGHGASAKPSGESNYSLALMASDALALADELRWEQFTLLGHSMGGMVAQLVAASAPERVSALVLMDTAHGPIDGLSADTVAPALHIVRTGGIGALAEAMAARESALETPAHRRLLAERPGYREFGDRKLLASSPDMYASIVAELLGHDDRLDALVSMEMPALVIVGEQDTPFVEPSKRMADALPHGRLAVIPDAGHSPQFESPEAWWEALSAFLEDVP